MWKSAYVGVYQLLNWKMHGETLKNNTVLWFYDTIFVCVAEYVIPG